MRRAIETGSLGITALGQTRAQEMPFHRFLSAPSVTVAEMAQTVGGRTAAAGAGQRILAIQDTTEINCAGRAARWRALGPAGDGVSPGVFLPPTIAVAAEQGEILGGVAAPRWTRATTPVGDRRGRTTVAVAPRRPGDPGRTATVALRAGPVAVKRPRHDVATPDPPSVALTLVEVRDGGSSGRRHPTAVAPADHPAGARESADRADRPRLSLARAE